jgi:hypothetical protein
MHQASMEQCRDLLAQMGLPVKVGSKVDVMGPDFGDSHGYDFTTGGGGIIDDMAKCYAEIKQMFTAAGKNPSNLHLDNFSKSVQFLCHYTTDAHTIGQISREFWGKIDNRIDASCEFVANKKKYPVALNTYGSEDAIREGVLASMRQVYDGYRRKAKKWYFIFSGAKRDMARNAVKCGAEFAASWVKLAWDQA